MSYSSDVTVRNIYGQFLTVDGDPASGTISLSASRRVVDDQDAIIFSAPVRVTLDNNGSFSVDIPTTDNRNLSPIGWYYTARIRIDGAAAYGFDFYFPEGNGSDVDITSIDTISQSASSARVPQGPVGPQGAQGPAGSPGAQGPAGSPGGAQGVQGATGIQGATGAQGLQGAAGSAGVQGAAGANGTQGTTGANGVQGATGSAGVQGVQGIQGPAGSGVSLQQLNDAIDAAVPTTTDTLTEGSGNLYFTTSRVSYTHTQSSASDTWTINHNLGFYPNVVVKGTDNVNYEGDISYPSANSVTVVFAYAIAGTAHLS